MWKYLSAAKIGANASLDVGDTVVIVVEKKIEGEKPLITTLSYGFDGKSTPGEFRAMVRREVRTHLNHLNGVGNKIDVTQSYTPQT